MKRFFLLISILVIFSMACSLGGFLSSGETSTQATEAPVSENRCGDGVCDGPENTENCPQDCLQGEEAAPQGTPVDELVPAPWFETEVDCLLEDIWSSSKGSPYAYDEFGNLGDALPDGQTTCVLEIHICGDMIFKQQVINSDAEDCPDYLDYNVVPDIQVCCPEWQKAKQSGVPCNPLEDADCDGVSNQDDNYPLDQMK